MLLCGVCGQQLFVPSHLQSLKSFESAQRQKLKGVSERVLCIFSSTTAPDEQAPRPHSTWIPVCVYMSSPVQVLSHLSLEQRGGWLAYLLSLLIENKHLYLPKTNMVSDQSPLGGMGGLTVASCP